MKALVCYYSRTGHTAEAGRAIAQAVNGREVAVQEYQTRQGPIAFLIAGMQAMTGRESRIQPLDIDWSVYDTVFLGSPVWASSPAPAINSLLKIADLSGKQVYLFATSLSRSGKTVFEGLSAQVEARGAQVAGTFHTATRGLEPGAIAALAQEWARGLFEGSRGP